MEVEIAESRDEFATNTASESAQSEPAPTAAASSASNNNNNNNNNGGGGGAESNIHMPDVKHDETFEPKITARFPATDYQDNPLNPMIVQFCYPGSDTIIPSTTYEMPRVHHFVLTNDRGRKMYGTCLTIMEEYKAAADGPWKSQATVTLQSDDEEEACGIEVSVDHQGKALYIPKVLCLLSTWPYLTAFREYLSQLYRLASATDVMTTPIERYIQNICQEIPAPPPGAYQVEVSILDSTIRFWAPPAKLPIAYVALPYQTLFECLDVENVLLLWRAMVTERKVLLVSSQYSILTVCAEILCSLLFPMKWSHLYVPMLPRMLCPILDAPVPYLCGIVRENWMNAEQYVSVDTIVVDLDRNSVIFGSQTPPLPPAPARKYHKLETTLTETVGHVFWKTRGLEKEYEAMMSRKSYKRSLKALRQMQSTGGQWVEKLAGMDHAFNLAYTPDSSNELGESLAGNERSQWDRVQEGFLRFFVALLKKYRNFLALPSQSLNDAATSPPAKPSFDLIGFVSSQKDDTAPFLSEMCMTQSFDDFLTRRMYSPGEPDLIFFDQSIDAKNNRSNLKLRKVETPFLHSAKAHKILKKLSAVEPTPSGLAGYDFERRKNPYMYKVWPETFDESLFCKPRSIPKMIAAEFDRQANLVSRLRASIVEDDEDEMLEFFGGDYDPSPEVASFTVFFFAYSALVGREWQAYTKKNREHTGMRDIPSNYDEPEVQQSPSFREGGNVCIPDCATCPDSSAISFKSAMQYVGVGADEAYKSIFPGSVDQFFEFQRQFSATRDVARNMSFPEADDALAEYEEAREVASAQLDLAFETLSTMDLRGLSADSDAYRSLMEACGRCGDTQRALKLMEVMKKDGFVANSEVLSCFVATFANNDGGGFDKTSSNAGPDAYSNYLQKQLDAVQEGDVPRLWADSDVPFTEEDCTTTSGSESELSGTDSKSTAPLDWFSNHPQQRRKKKGRKRRNRLVSARLEAMPLTDILSRQITLGESILDFLYPDLAIDTKSDSCPQCSHVLSESNIVEGWLPCSFQDYTTHCPECQHRFVPRFVVTCASPTFEGSQGSQTPLYCEFLSPWVLRKELQKVIKGETGIEGMLRPEWRSGADIRATLYWNLIVLCRRYRLPFSFLMQGNFQNCLVLPRSPEELSKSET